MAKKNSPQPRYDAAVVAPTLPGHPRSLLASTLVRYLRCLGLSVASVSTAGNPGCSFRLGSMSSDAAVAEAAAVISYDSRFRPPTPSAFAEFKQAQVLALNDCPSNSELPFLPNWVVAPPKLLKGCQSLVDAGASLLPAPFFAGRHGVEPSESVSAVAVVVSRDTVDQGLVPLVLAAVQELRDMTSRKIYLVQVGSVPPGTFSQAKLSAADVTLLRLRDYDSYYLFLSFVRVALLFETPRTWGVLTQLAAAAGAIPVVWDTPLASRWVVHGRGGALIPCELYRSPGGVYLPIPSLNDILDSVEMGIEMANGYRGWRSSQALLADASAAFDRAWRSFFNLPGS